MVMHNATKRYYKHPIIFQQQGKIQCYILCAVTNQFFLHKDDDSMGVFEQSKMGSTIWMSILLEFFCKYLNQYQN